MRRWLAEGRKAKLSDRHQRILLTARTQHGGLLGVDGEDAAGGEAALQQQHRVLPHGVEGLLVQRVGRLLRMHARLEEDLRRAIGFEEIRTCFGVNLEHASNRIWPVGERLLRVHACLEQTLRLAADYTVTVQ